ncbi:MAG: lycopene cyclase domain-containing protein [Acidimicrobiales bacterium]
MDHAQYLLVLAFCVVATLPLEVVARVWRRPVRLAKAVVLPLVIFSAWDIAAIAHHQWSFASRYITGVKLPGGLPLEEVLFFLVVPTCAILTFETVRWVLAMLRQPVGRKWIEG